ncbi:hypothetical protein POMI540_3452 [Schizosaccharomyces pombe]|uniref:Uncharacterized protein C1B3.20 n=1 Tax=Schizosaccharomyces pombe (strain 972 / ATCC 24843) TaxID=284812 RepID=YE1K_SCHPO|nr:uncharacterized protein SPAC1B3.20 [Schizosaccharomyces pombe]Q9Y7I1.1 RecName: Full=Uncharacterized protein C1B3.20 [Schizosaccharomyces pombe 972h-]CAB40188.1 sequence orphan [Schizosaccharomyces pombe]|eukprot:NP_594795.1 uncharacterized protein SPAC1B3.20 [Schizosaccharomyces pombe]
MSSNSNTDHSTGDNRSKSEKQTDLRNALRETESHGMPPLRGPAGFPVNPRPFSHGGNANLDRLNLKEPVDLEGPKDEQ